MTAVSTQEQFLQEWFTRRDGVERGPYSAEHLARHILLGRIRLQDEISQDRTHWVTADSFPELMPPELANLSSWEDYQQLAVARSELDERRSQRRCRDCRNYLKCNRERRVSGERRRPDSVFPAFGQLFTGLTAPPMDKHPPGRVRALLLASLLAILLFAWHYPSWQ